METWKVTAIFPDDRIVFSCEKRELIEKFSKYLPAIVKDDFKALSVSIGDLNLSILPEQKDKVKKVWKPRKRSGQKKRLPKSS
jgi:hypothetical protein